MIDFLTDNPFLIFILIGIISSLFGKEKMKEDSRHTGRQKPNGPQRSQTAAPQRPQQQAKPLTPVTPHKPSVSKSARIEDASKENAAEKANQTKRILESYIQESGEGIDPHPEGHRAFQKEVYEQEEKINQKAKEGLQREPGRKLPEFSRNQLVNGIIMSEILGPPRAKKPFQRMK